MKENKRTASKSGERSAAYGIHNTERPHGRAIKSQQTPARSTTGSSSAPRRAAAPTQVSHHPPLVSQHASTVAVLKADRSKPVRQGHPWVFSGALQSLPAGVADGEIIDLVDTNDEWLARGYLNRTSQIQLRLLSWRKEEPIDEQFWLSKLQQAIERRQSLSTISNALRLINGENDYLPGLIVDRYADYLVLQSGTLGIDQHKTWLAEQLLRLTGCRGVIERSEMAVRKQEGLGPAVGLLAGEAPTTQIEIFENGLHFTVDMTDGQKTGFYSDQRSNRQRVAAYCQGARMLNAFSYTGAFAIHALAKGARHVTNIDTSVEALQLAETHIERNGFDPALHSENIAGDVFQVLRHWRTERWDGINATAGEFDVIVLDPPKFVQNRGGLDQALRGYKDINMLAMQLIAPNGILATFSCSSLVSADLFQKVVFGAAVDAGRQVQIIERLSQDVDHPVAITFPEGEYLKGLICRVI